MEIVFISAAEMGSSIEESTLIETVQAEPAAGRLSGETDLETACSKAAFITVRTTAVRGLPSSVFVRSAEFPID